MVVGKKNTDHICSAPIPARPRTPYVRYQSAARIKSKFSGYKKILLNPVLSAHASNFGGNHYVVHFSINKWSPLRHILRCIHT
jgi:hypothetical protein